MNPIKKLPGSPGEFFYWHNNAQKLRGGPARYCLRRESLLSTQAKVNSALPPRHVVSEVRFSMYTSWLMLSQACFAWATTYSRAPFVPPWYVINSTLNVCSCPSVTAGAEALAAGASETAPSRFEGGSVSSCFYQKIRLNAALSSIWLKATEKLSCDSIRNS